MREYKKIRRKYKQRQKRKYNLVKTATITTPLVTAIIRDAPDGSIFTTAEAATCYDKINGDDEFISPFTDYYHDLMN